MSQRLDDVDLEEANEEDVMVNEEEEMSIPEERDEVVWLYCLVFPVKVPKKSDLEVRLEREAILDQLNNSKLVTLQFYSTTNSHVFVKVGATESRLLLEADIQNYELQLDSKAIKKVCESTKDLDLYGRAPVFLDYPYDSNVDIPHDFKARDAMGNWYDMSQAQAASFIRDETPMSPWKYLFVRYNDVWENRILNDHGVQVYKTYEDGTILRPADRIKLCRLAMLRSDSKDPEHGLPGAGLFLDKLIYSKRMSAAYPLQLGTSRMSTKELTPDQLFKEWNALGSMPWHQPLEKIRNYAGEKIAMYFAFLGHYTLWLLAPAIIGTVIFGRQVYFVYVATGGYDVVGPGGAEIIPVLNDENEIVDFNTDLHTRVPEAPIFALFISLWASFLIEFWKRKQATFALKWGMSNFEKEANNRVAFRPTHVIPSPVNGEPIEYYSKLRFLSKIAVSASVIFTAIVFVVATIGSILVLKVFMSSTQDILPEAIAPQIALAVNAVAIIVLGQIYKKVARVLNDWENHRTDIQYEDHLIAKTFMFSFVNSYATLTYYAFIKSGTDILNVTQYCIASAEAINIESNGTLTEEQLTKLREADLCYGSLAYSLFIIFGSQIFINNAMEIGMPYVMSKVKSFLDLRAHAKRIKAGAEDVGKVMKDGIEEAGNKVGLPKPESVSDRDDDEEKADMEIDLEDLAVRRRMKSPLESQFYLKQYETPFDDYLELALQFGYVTLFVAAFPIAPLLALLSNVLEVRIDSFKVCMLCRRPDMAGAQDIGTWQSIFEIMGFIAVVSNASVILFTADFITVEKDERVWLWIMFIVFVMTVKKIVDFIIADVPKSVNIQRQRNAFIINKVFKAERDEEKLSDTEKRRNSHRYSLTRSIHTIDPFIHKLLRRAADGLKAAKGEDWNMHEIFREADENRNGVLSIKELKKALLADPKGLPSFLTNFEIAILVSSMDVDGDGTISKPEFKRFLNL
mmetsp:Transcript_9856/g.17332  ORF Transcript_9856/g.17332 Transcript_9856/m.17332 type:complete len:968 (-) Transcript_9856:264-3167(-)